MRRTGRKKEWSIVLFCGGILVLLPPVLALFDRSDFDFGVPKAYVFLYGIWAFIIAAIAYGARRGSKPSSSLETETLPIDEKGEG